MEAGTTQNALELSFYEAAMTISYRLHVFIEVMEHRFFRRVSCFIADSKKSTSAAVQSESREDCRFANM